MSIEMKVFDIFHLQTGETIFAGLITGSEKLFKTRKMQLLIDNQKYQTVKIEGEMLMDRKKSLNHRAVSTTDSIDLTSDFIENHECRLVEADN